MTTLCSPADNVKATKSSTMNEMRGTLTIVPEKVEMCTKVGRKLEGRVHLFTYLWLIYDVVSGSDNIASNDEHKMYLKGYGRKMSDLI